MAKKTMREIESKRGQVTLFIIIGIIIIAGILVFFLWVRPTYITGSTENLGFENCVADAIEQDISTLGNTAGLLKPEFSFTHKGEEFVYLCYTNEYYKPCITQQPFLKQQFEDQLSLMVREKILLCYSSSLDELKSKGYGVVEGKLDYKIYLEPGTVRVEINAPTVIDSQSFKKFSVQIPSAIYEMVMLATSIIQGETHYGDFETSGMMILYPDYIIDKLKQSEGTTLYIIQSKIFNNKFQFASRSLAWPIGNIL
ncbi:MAG: hypothetical protein NUV97_00685 [archaeon]|nr:hypothetical protein [archaeon]MCR4323345.1 hypothetical protein [Nanoarchaeota archaeon]